MLSVNWKKKIIFILLGYFAKSGSGDVRLINCINLCHHANHSSARDELIKLPCVPCHGAIIPRREFWICVLRRFFTVTELWDVPSLKLASPSLLSLWVERSQNGLDPVRAISVAVITHIYVGIFTQRDAHKREPAACVCHPGGYNLFLAGHFLDSIQLTGLRAGFCLPSCSSLMLFLCRSSTKGRLLHWATFC